ncbi:N-acetylmuramoyl-L-alanine amidase-like domain-containing protein [Legionella jordanis]|uniref:DUF1460 domain-containing protein n=1 Tax=Legionella jordanis TaxID=456 RepID=A0A0W0VAH1_9GAMM|nr:N-acetylmuramoyl-L-alanine amidase-like domain-containing protein [Legionella jordanis]KTD16854.1 hypothetical protein Ljor_1160 [Legionella jordanis]RMX00359.1 DUF1460 domain-containing protein [Legionella jordanis]RMX15539.1 DUF1460 domain-containing protein [Legionella jordanis]VEH13551.1 Protein of uncharacterised function (DUF1460) [Legionella jordanis]HAT8715195.1 DUF1460 domain-containing protein [Legionella jordanis]
MTLSADQVKASVRFIYVIFFMLLSSLSLANVHPKQEQADAIINGLYHNLHNNPNSDMATRLETISAQFLGKDYVLGALGEGVKGRFDQAPRYRVDGFDCETFVDTVLAIALADNIQDFRQCICRIRYENGRVSYINRNHFTSIDWNRNNQHQGFLKDITQTFTDVNKQPVSLMTTALIDKPSWYQFHTLASIRLYPENKQEQMLRLAELKNRGSKLSKLPSELPYLPFTVLFNSQGEPNQHLFSQIPNGAIIEIVRPNWNLKDKIGTELDISHLGFAFWKNGALVFREASTVYGHVVDVPLIDYLKEARTSPTIKGINVQIVVPGNPLTNGCELTQ